MELEEVLGKRPGPPPTYEVIFRVVAAGRNSPSVPSWQPENVILHSCRPAREVRPVAQAAEEAEDGGARGAGAGGGGSAGGRGDRRQPGGGAAHLPLAIHRGDLAQEQAGASGRQAVSRRLMFYSWMSV